MPADEFAEHSTIIGSHGEIASFEQLFLFETRPFAVDLTALDSTTDHHHETPMAMIGAGIAVLFDGTAEFGHRHHNDIFHTIAQVLAERPDGVGKLPQKVRELLTLVAVVIPPAHFGE